MIRKCKGGYVVVGEEGKRLSRVYASRSEAEKRLQEIEYYKWKSKK